VIQYRILIPDGQTDRQTHKRTPFEYRVHAWHRAGND